MIEYQDVLDRFCFFAKLNKDDASDYSDTIKMIIDETHKKIKTGVSVDENRLVLTEVAASMSYYRYVLLSNISPQKILANDIKINIDNTKKLDVAKKLRDEALLSACDLIHDENFLFETM